MIEFGVIYFVLVVQSMGEEIADRVYFALLGDCVYMARELNSTYTGNPPVRAYCIPETVSPLKKEE